MISETGPADTYDAKILNQLNLVYFAGLFGPSKTWTNRTCTLNGKNRLKLNFMFKMYVLCYFRPIHGICKIKGLRVKRYKTQMVFKSKGPKN